MAEFAHLHSHSEYSLLDGASRIKDMVRHVLALGQPALALTDHGNLSGAIEFYKACQEASREAVGHGARGIKPILGLEAYITPGGGSRHDRERVDGEYAHHCLLWAEDKRGFDNLVLLSSKAYTEGFYKYPRIDRELLARHSAGVLASSGCIAAEIPKIFLSKGLDAARGAAAVYVEIFGARNFYFELQNHVCMPPKQARPEARDLAVRQQAVNAAMVQLAREFGSKVICTNDSHYTKREDVIAHDVVLCIGTRARLADPKRFRFPCEEFYLKSAQEMRQLFYGHPDALRNTLEVAERCNVALKFGEYHYPTFPPPMGEDPCILFRRQVEQGLKARFGEIIPSEVQIRAEAEVRVLHKMGFVGYLLVVWDIVREARSRGIPVGPGRGSAAGSMVCYALGITDLDPLRYGLLFERFVNEGRNEMPDIDLDFAHEQREEIIRYVREKYGHENTAGVITFMSLGAKAALRDVGRVFGLSLTQVNNLVNLVPQGTGVTLQPRAAEDGALHVLEDVQEFRDAYFSDATVRQWVDLARKVEGLHRNPGKHAAGLVIADKPITAYCPVCRDKENQPITQFEMSHLDALGLLKIDLLGLQTLSSLDLAMRMIRERHGIVLQLPNLPLNDAKTFQLLSRGETKGVFQFESEGMVRLLREACPDRLEDLIALNAMFRPGPIQNLQEFIGRKHGRLPITYLVLQLEPILKETYGIIVYQEQVMQIANQLAGFTLSEADTLRKAMGKKKKDLMEQYEKRFVEGCVQNGMSMDKARPLYDLVARFAEYGFNKSHATAYSLIAYRTAYLKTHFPAEFMAALLTVEPAPDKGAEYVAEAQRLGLRLLSPDVNASHSWFILEGKDGGALRTPLGAVKGLRDTAVAALIDMRRKHGPFKTPYDLCSRVALMRSEVEGLIGAGALDSISEGLNHEQLYTNVGGIMAQAAQDRKDRAAGQRSLFEAS